MPNVPILDNPQGSQAIPTLSGQQVSPAAMPDIGRAIPPATANAQAGAEMGQAVSHVAGQLSDVIVHEQNEANRFRVMDTGNQFDARALALVGEVHAVKGQAALGASQAAYGDLGKYSQTLQDGLANEPQRRLFAAHAQSSMLNFQGHIEPYVAQENHNYMLQTATVAMMVDAQNATAAAGDPMQMQMHLDNLRQHSMDVAKLQGLPPEVADYNTRKAISGIYGDVINGKIAAGRGIEAQLYFNDHKDQIAARDIAQMQHHVTAAVTAEGTDRFFAMASEGNTAGADRLITELQAHGVSAKSLFEIQTMAQHQLYTAALNAVDARLNNGDPEGAKVVAKEWSAKFKSGGDTFYHQMVARADAGATHKTEMDTAKTAWLDAFKGHNPDGPLPLDNESKNAAVADILRNRIGRYEDVAKFFAFRGIEQPKVIKDHLKAMFSPGTTPQQAAKGLDILNAMGPSVGQTVAGSIDDGHKGMIPQTIFNLSQGASPEDVQKIIKTMTGPVAMRQMGDINKQIVGDGLEKPKVNALDVTKLMGGSPLDFNGLTAFQATARYEMVKAMENGTTLENLQTMGPQIAARFKEKHAMLNVPLASVGGFSMSDTRLESILVPKGMAPDAKAMEKLSAAMVTHVSDAFGYQNPWFGYNSYKGQYRPDLAVSVAGNAGYFIPAMIDAMPIGFLHWDPTTGRAEAVTNPDVQKKIVSVMTAVSSPETWRGDPRLRWHDSYQSRTLFGLPEDDTQKALLRGLRDWTTRQYSGLNDGRAANLDDPAQHALYMNIMEKAARLHGWDGLGQEKPSATPNR